MEGVDVSGRDGPPGRHERLGCNLTTEHPLPLLVGLHATEDVLFDRFEIQQTDEEVKGCTHGAMLAGIAEWKRTSYGATHA